MEKRYNRRALTEGLKKLIDKSDYRLLAIMFELWRYILGEDDTI